MTKYKVLIVEDVDIIREDLRKIINWERHGFIIVGEAKNGEVGVALFKTHQPDVVITDIRMPVMTGLEMISEIRKQSADARFILLTAFEEFEYAKAAVNLDVHSYVMKYELDEEVLLRELRKQIAAIERQKSIWRMEKSISLKKLLEEKGSEQEHVGFFRWYCRNALLVVELAAESGGAHQGGADLQARMYEGFRGLSGFDAASYEFELVELSPDEHLVFLKVPESLSDSKSMRYIRTFLGLYQNILGGENGVRATVAIGGYVYGPNDIAHMYRNGKSIARQKVFHSGGCILDRPAPEPAPELKARVREELDAVRQGIAGLDAASLEDRISGLFTGLLKSARSNELLEMCVREITYAIAALSAGQETDSFTELLDEVMDYSRRANIYELSEMFVKTLETMRRAKDSRYSKRAQSIIRYIDEHYGSDISLHSLARHLDLSAIYISQMFKKEVGITISSYITQVRMRKAVALLESGRYKVYEVSEMVGYQTVQYFSKIFKKETGRKPSDFSDR